MNLSGGIDSTVTATLATGALGSERVTGLILPTRSNRDQGIDDARQVAEELVIDYRVIDLQRLVDDVTTRLASETPRTFHDPVDGRSGVMTVPSKRRGGYTEAVGNITGRLRMMAAYFEANMTNSLVLGTGNRTELLLGYFTKYGDGGVDVLPIGDLYKTEVYQLARKLQVREEILAKNPTAGLWPGQEDEAELGAPYERIDTILWNLFDTDAKRGEIAAGLSIEREEVAGIEGVIEEGRHKRNVPPTPMRSHREPEIARSPPTGDEP